MYRVLRHWRGILVAAVLMAAAACAFIFLKNASAPSSAGESARTSYEAALKAYEKDRESYASLIERTKALLTEKRAYLSDSILMQLDPAHVGKASATLVVTVPEDGSASPEQLVDAYASFCSSGADLSALAEELGTEEGYVAELITTNPSVNTTNVYSSVGDAAAYTGQAARGTLTVTAVHSDEETAEKILSEILSQLTERSEAFSSEYGEHSLKTGEISTGTYPDTAIGSRSETLLQELYMLSTNEERLEAQFAKLKKPAMPTEASRSVSAKTLIKYALLGFIGGLVLAILVLMIFLTLRGKVLSAAELSSVFSLRKLAVIPESKVRTSFLDRLVEKLDSEQKNGAAPAGRYRIAAESIFAQIQAHSQQEAPAQVQAPKCLLVGTVSSDLLENCRQGLAASFLEIGALPSVPDLITAGSLAASPESHRLLADADGVVLVEKIGASSYPAVAEELSILSAHTVPILGTIVL